MATRRTRMVLAAVASAGALALVPGVAGATPGNGSPAFTVPFTCDGQPLTFVVENLGIFGTAYVVETGQMFVPTSFTLNGRLLSAKEGTVPLPQVTCITPQAPAGGTLVVTGYFVPPTN
jgi:hypothetical protein